MCIADASPESSQLCAQELAGKNVEMVLIGLDLFPDYATYDAADIPVAGIIPLFPADYASDAIYFGGGNATLAAGNAYVAKEYFEAEKVAIISADNARRQQLRGRRSSLPSTRPVSSTGRSRAPRARPMPVRRDLFARRSATTRIC